jgi:hypothetical protein
MNLNALWFGLSLVWLTIVVVAIAYVIFAQQVLS